MQARVAGLGEIFVWQKCSAVVRIKVEVAYSDIFGCKSSSSRAIVRTNCLLSSQLKKLGNILVSLRERDKTLKVHSN